LETNDETELLKIGEYLEDKEIDFTMFHEPDNCAGNTAIAVGPIYGKDRKFFKKFKFYK
jgi:hypothetical protein